MASNRRPFATVFFNKINVCIANCLLSGLFVLTNCVQEYDGPIPVQTVKPVVNAILYADSALHLHISMARPMGSKVQFVNVDNALVKIAENNTPLGEAALVSNGEYVSGFVVKEGASYSMEVTIPGYETITAATKVPVRSNIEASLQQIGQGWNGTSNFTLQIERPNEVIGGYWVVVNNISPKYGNGEQVHTLYSNSALADNFNRTIDVGAPHGYTFCFDDFIRVHGEALGFEKNSLTFAPVDGLDAAVVSVVTGSKEYDGYFRALFLQKSWNPDSSLPFTYRPVIIPSNVVNGYGIFAGCTVSRFEFPNTALYRTDN